MNSDYARASERAMELRKIYSGKNVCAANVLCDRRPADQLAYRIVESDLSFTDYNYGELKTESEKFAKVLADHGVKPGDKVATLMGKSWDYLVTLMGIWRLGAVHVPLFTAFAPPAIAFRLESSSAVVVICDDSQHAKLSPSEDIPEKPNWTVITTGEATGNSLNYADLMAKSEIGYPAAVLGGDAPLIQVYTSGTTGKPKGVVVPMRALAAFHVYGEFGLGIQDNDIFWCAADPGWAYGLYFGVLVTFLTGVRSILLSAGFDAESTLQVLADHKVTNFAAAPTVYRSLRTSGAPVPEAMSLRCASSAGEPLTPEVNEWAEKALNVTVHDHYGQTEAGMLINNHHNPLVKRPIKPRSMGLSMPGWRGVVLDDNEDRELGSNDMGRIAFDLEKSPLAWFSGYVENEEKSAERFAGNGRWYVTGDTGMVDEDGYFHFSSRDDDVIIMAGYRIGPFDVESVLARHAAVAESAVIAVPDEVRGEVIEAYVVLCEGVEGTDALIKELQTWVKTKFAAHAYPRKVHFIKGMPKTPSGKIQRFELKKRRMTEIGQR